MSKGIEVSDAAPKRIVLMLSKDPADEDRVLDVQTFIINGEDVIPIFSDVEAFKSQSKGSGFEDKGMEIDLEFYLGLLKGQEIFILNPGSENPQRFTASELTNWAKS